NSTSTSNGNGNGNGASLRALASAARKAANRGPCEAARWRRISPQGRAHDARAFAAGAGMHRQRTPQPPREPAGQDARRAPRRGALSLGYFSLGTQREVARGGRG